MQQGETLMADWFKMYEDGLDAAEMRYAIHKNKHITSVWVWILTQCCKKKSDEMRFNAFILFGGSQALNIEQTEFSDCLDILSEIGYVEYDNETILVPKWGDRQSEYCKKKGRKKMSGECTDNVSREEKREEKSRKDEKKNTYASSESIVEQWNTLVCNTSIPKINSITSTRRKKYVARCESIGGEGNFWAILEDEIPKLNKFVKDGTFFDFNYVVRSEDTLGKLAEGGWREKKKVRREQCT